MKNKLWAGIGSLVLAMAVTLPSFAETVIEKVARTGVLTVSTRTDIIPYSYVDDKNELVGYSIDVTNLIKNELEKRLGKEIFVDYVIEEDISDRIEKIINREIDLACTTAFTWEREQVVDFSESYSITGLRLLVKKGSSLGAPESLVGKRIGTLPKTFAESAIKLIQPEAIIVPTTTVEEGFAALRDGKVDALVGDSVILDGQRQTMNPDNYELVPTEPYARFGMACILPENDSSFRELVNYSLLKMMDNYLAGEQAAVEIIERWFGPQGVVSIDENLLKSFFQFTIITREQIPPSK